MFDVITIGSATKDIFLISDKFKIKKNNSSPTGAFECVPLGVKIEINRPFYTTGGGGTNSAATFASLGLKTAIICKLGSDSVARDIIYDLKKIKVNTKFIKHEKGFTGLSVILSAKSGERTILVSRGVSSNFTENDIPFKKIKTKWIYITSLAGNIKLLKKIITFADKNNIKTAFNPGEQELRYGIKILKPLLRKCDFILLNKEEAQKLHHKKIRNLLKLLTAFKLPRSIIAITNGQQGAAVQADGKIYFINPRKIKPISQTGAGDAFGSGLVTGLIKNYDIETALKLGALNAESVIQEYGAKNGILKQLPTSAHLNKIKILKY